MNTIRPLIEDKNLDGAQAFLDMFGLTITEYECFDEEGKAYIEKDGKYAGFIAEDNGRITILVQTDLGLLKATFKAVEDSYEEREFKYRTEIVQKYQMKINYDLFLSGEEHITGNHILECEKQGIKNFRCFATHDLIYTVNKTKKFSLAFYGKAFVVEFFDGDTKETISISPFVSHEIRKEKQGEFGDSYKKYFGIFKGFIKSGVRTLHVFKETIENGESKDFISDFCEIEGHQDSPSFSNTKDVIIQIGRVIREMDPDVLTKIQELKNILKMNDTSLLDELINVCLANYDDEMIKALFGYVPKIDMEPIKPLVIWPKN